MLIYIVKLLLFLIVFYNSKKLGDSKLDLLFIVCVDKNSLNPIFYVPKTTNQPMGQIMRFELRGIHYNVGDGRRQTRTMEGKNRFDPIVMNYGTVFHLEHIYSERVGEREREREREWERESS